MPRPNSPQESAGPFDMFAYFERLAIREKVLRSRGYSFSRLARCFGNLVIEANDYLDRDHTRAIGKEVILGQDAIENCRVGEYQEGKVVIVPFEVEEDEYEVSATYHGLHLMHEDFGYDVSLSRLSIVSRLLVASEIVDDPLYKRTEEKYAILPLEFSDQLEFIP